MGMFTSFLHPEDHRELQIKTECDDCETYRFGELVSWQVWEDKPGTGKLLDGVYLSYSEKGIDDDYVVIWGHRYVGVIPVNESVLARLLKEVIPEYDRSWWLKSAWVQKEKRDLEYSLLRDQERLTFLLTLTNKTEEEIKKASEEFLGKSLAKAIRENIGFESILKKVFTVTPVNDTDGKTY